jgi:rubrerythrin
MEPVSLAILGGIGWIGVLAKNYYTEMARLAVERSKQDQKNEQNRIEKSEKVFDILLGNVLTLVGEEKDSRLFNQQQMEQTLRELIKSNNQAHADWQNVREDMRSLITTIRNTTAETVNWEGDERRRTR